MLSLGIGDRCSTCHYLNVIAEQFSRHMTRQTRTISPIFEFQTPIVNMAESLTEATPWKGRYGHLKETPVDVAPAVIIRPFRPVLPNGRHPLPTDTPFYLKRSFLHYHDLDQDTAKQLAVKMQWNTRTLLDNNNPPPGWETMEGKSKPHSYRKRPTASFDSSSDESGSQPNIPPAPSSPDNEVSLRPLLSSSRNGTSNSSPTSPPAQSSAERPLDTVKSKLDSEKRLAIRMRGREGMENPNGPCEKCLTRNLKLGATLTCYVFREPGKSNRCDHCAWSHSTATRCNLMTEAEKEAHKAKRAHKRSVVRREKELAMREQHPVEP